MDGCFKSNYLLEESLIKLSCDKEESCADIKKEFINALKNQDFSTIKNLMREENSRSVLWSNGSRSSAFTLGWILFLLENNQKKSLNIIRDELDSFDINETIQLSEKDRQIFKSITNNAVPLIHWLVINLDIKTLSNMDSMKLHCLYI